MKEAIQFAGHVREKKIIPMTRIYNIIRERSERFSFDHTVGRP